MNDYIPAHLEGIQENLKTILEAAEQAAQYIEAGPTYQNHLHPFHNSAVATYNRLVSIIIELEHYKISE